jgi:hypothetical protein
MFNVREAKFRMIIRVMKKNTLIYKNRPQKYLQGRFLSRILFKNAAFPNKIPLEI